MELKIIYESADAAMNVLKPLSKENSELGYLLEELEMMGEPSVFEATVISLAQFYSNNYISLFKENLKSALNGVRGIEEGLN